MLENWPTLQRRSYGMEWCLRRAVEQVTLGWLLPLAKVNISRIFNLVFFASSTLLCSQFTLIRERQ